MACYALLKGWIYFGATYRGVLGVLVDGDCMMGRFDT